MKIVIALAIMALGLVAHRANASTTNVQTVPSVDLTKFLGKWYEIAVIPYFFERNCTGTNANYALRADGKIDVHNICNKKSLDGKLSEARGVAVVANNNNAKLKVSFFGPIYANYWIIDLGKNYEYAVTANPNRKYLWILSRTPRMDENTYQEIVSRAAQQGFDVSKLVRTLQP